MARMILKLSQVVFFMSMMSSVVQAKNGFYPTNFTPFKIQSTGKATADEPVPVKLLYYGGPVISNAKTFVVFWSSAVDKETQDKIGGFYKAISRSTYLDWLDEYNTDLFAVDGRWGTQQHIGRGEFLGAVTINPANTSSTIDDVDIQAELQNQINSGVLPKPGENTLYMTYFPPDFKITSAGMSSCSDFCAYHGFKGDPASPHFYYGVMPDIGGACSFGCSNGPSHFESVTSISSHEYIEAITDPYPTPGDKPAYPQAWNNAAGYEIADICIGNGNNDLSSVPINYVVQSEWDNRTSSCTAQSWTDNP